MFGLIDGFIRQHGVLGVALLMLIENLIPAIPSELILPLAGFEVAQGLLPAPQTVMAATLGSVAGGAVWYLVGRRFGLSRAMDWCARGGRWTTITPSALHKGYVWFQRWGGLAVFLGRTLPGVRSFICIPAGIARQRPWAFLAWSSLGALAWSSLLVLSGFVLQANYSAVRQWIDPVLDGFVALCLVSYVVRLATRGSRPR